MAQLFQVNTFGYTFNQDEFNAIGKEIAELSCSLRNKLEELTEMLNDAMDTQFITLSDEEEYNMSDIELLANQVADIEDLFFEED